MVAPFLARIDKAISQSVDEVARARLLAEKACYLVRIGDLTQAEEIRSILRATYSDGRDLKTSVQIMVLEGLLSFFKSLGGNARDRLARAEFLSIAAGDKELIALTASWLAHIQFVEDDIPAAIESIKKSIESVQVGQWGVLTRISLLVTNFFIAFGDFGASKLWYSLARHAAVEYGDHAAIGALIYNTAASKMSSMRLKSVSGKEISEDTIDLLAAEARTASNYHYASGTTGLEYMLTSLDAGIDILRHEYTDALSILAPLLESGEIPESYGYGKVLLSDALLCCVKLGYLDRAELYIKKLNEVDIDALHITDRIIIYGNINFIDGSKFCDASVRVKFDQLSGLINKYDVDCSGYLSRLSDLNDIPANLRW